MRAVMAASARALTAAFPEVDCTAFSESVAALDNLIVDANVHVQQRAQSIYTTDICKPLQTTADHIRNGTTPLALAADAKVFARSIATRSSVTRRYGGLHSRSGCRFSPHQPVCSWHPL